MGRRVNGVRNHMKNLLISLGLGALISVLFSASSLLTPGESALPGVMVAIVAFFVLARKTMKLLEGTFAVVTKELQARPPRTANALKVLEDARGAAKAQFGLSSQLDNQIGVIHFLQQDFNAAMPYLQRSLTFGHWMGGIMLAVIQYKKKNHDDMRKTLDALERKGKKSGLYWSVRAYLLDQVGERDNAQQVLAKGIEKVPEDTKLKDNLQALQNGKKMKMKSYNMQWYQLHLEKPPAMVQQNPMQPRMSKAQRRGR